MSDSQIPKYLPVSPLHFVLLVISYTTALILIAWLNRVLG